GAERADQRLCRSACRSAGPAPGTGAGGGAAFRGAYPHRRLPRLDRRGAGAGERDLPATRRGGGLNRPAAQPHQGYEGLSAGRRMRMAQRRSGDSRIGFIGMGVMGAPMAANLAAAGYRLSVFDSDRGRAETAAARGRGIDVATSAAGAAADADIVITMLPNGEVVRQVMCGAGGVGAAMKAGALLLDTSSSEPWHTRATAAELAGRGVVMVDAPVSGAQWG